MANFMDPNLPMLPRSGQSSAMTLAELLRSGKTPEEINALRSGSTVSSGSLDPNFMAGEPYMPPQQTQPINSLVNMRTGREVPLLDSMGRPSQSQMQRPIGDMSQNPVDTPFGRGYYMKGDNTRVVLADGRIADLGRDTGRERAMMKENLALEKTRAEIAAMQAKPQLESPQQKLANELIAAEARSKLPYTPEGTRLAAIKLEEEKAKMGKALPSPAVTSLSAAGAAVEDTSRSKRTFKDEYGGKTIMGRLSNTIGKLVGDDTGQVQWWQDYDSAQNLARNALFGSALTNTEKEAWEMIAVNPRMDANEIKKNIDRKQALEARAASKLGRAYAAGGYSKDQIKELLGDAAVYLESGASSVTDPSNNAVGAVKVNSVNEAMKLKSGTRFIDPNGVERVRP